MSAHNNLPLCKFRYAFFVSYLGSRYNGSQRQTLRKEVGTQNTIQEALEWSLESILPKSKCRLTAASRTDKGVHALMNCYSLSLQDYSLSTVALRKQCNFNLIKNHHEIIIKDVILVPADFHPRKMASSREYIYRIAIPNNYRSSHLKKYSHGAELAHALPVNELYKVSPLPFINLEKAEEALNLFKGRHDFLSFALSLNQSEDTTRDLEIKFEPVEPIVIDSFRSSGFSLYHIHLKSKSFLHNMVRRIVGAVISYACYDRVKLDEIKYLLDNPVEKSWKSNIIVAEPNGLFLSKVNYDRSVFDGSIRTLEDKSQEKVNGFFDFPSEKSVSDDESSDNAPDVPIN